MNRALTGGPAFPRPCSEADGDKGEMWNDSEIGMTLLDYFAAAALPGVMAGQIEIAKQGKDFDPDTMSYSAAEAAYDVALSMIKQRNLISTPPTKAPTDTAK